MNTLLLRLSVGATLLFIAYFMASTLAPFLAVSLGVPPATLGAIVSATFVLPLFLAIPAGRGVDAFGSRPLLVAGMMLLAIAPLGVILRPSVVTLLLLQVLTGLGQLLAVVAAQALVAQLGVGRLRERNYGVYGAFVSVGQLIGPITAGAMLDGVGFVGAFSLVIAVAVAGIVMFVSLGPTRVRLDRSAKPPRRTKEAFAPSQRAAGERAAFPSARVSDLLALSPVRVSLGVSAVIMIVMVVHTSFLPAFLEGFAVPATLIGAAVSMRSLAAVAVRPFLASIVEAAGSRLRTFLATLALAAIGTAVLAVASPIAWQFVAALVLGVAVGVAQPLTMASIVEHVPSRQHGFALGTRITANRLTQVLAPLLVGGLAQVLGYGAAFLVAGAAIGLVAVAVAWTQRRAPSEGRS